jgi:O-antigen ligase
MATITAAPSAHEAAGRHGWLLAGFFLVAFGAASGYMLAVGELEALYVTLSLMMCIAVLVDFRIGAVALVLMLPASDTTLFPRGMMGISGLNPVNLLLAGTLASFALRSRWEELRRFMPWQLLWLFIVPIMLAGLLGSRHALDIMPYFYEIGAIDFTDAAGYLRELVVKPLVMVMVALMLGAAVAKSRRPEAFIVAMAISVWFIAMLQFGFIIATGVRLGSLASASARAFFDTIGVHANDLGRLYVVAYALLVFAWWESKSRAQQGFLFVTLGVLSFALLLTFSRGAFVGFALVSLWFMAKKFNAKTVTLAALALLVLAVFLPGFVYDRVLLGVDEGDANVVTAGRIEFIWMPLLPELARSPVWGSGLSSILWSYPMVTESMLPVGHPHNAYLEALLDMGVAGLVLLLAYYGHVWMRFHALSRDPELSPQMRALFQGALAGLAAFFVTGMAGSSLRPTGEFAFLWMAIGMMYGIYARRPAG